MSATHGPEKSTSARGAYAELAPCGRQRPALGAASVMAVLWPCCWRVRLASPAASVAAMAWPCCCRGCIASLVASARGSRAVWPGVLSTQAIAASYSSAASSTPAGMRPSFSLCGELILSLRRSSRKRSASCEALLASGRGAAVAGPRSEFLAGAGARLPSARAAVVAGRLAPAVPLATHVRSSAFRSVNLSPLGSRQLIGLPSPIAGLAGRRPRAPSTT